MARGGLTGINTQVAAGARRVAISRPLLLAITASLLWAVLAFAYANPTYGPPAIVASVVVFAGAMGFFIWDAPLARTPLRVVGLVVAVQTFLSAGLSVIGEINPDFTKSRPTTEGYTFAVVSNVVFAASFLLGVWLACPTRPPKSKPFAESGPTASMSWIVASLAAVTLLANGLGMGKSLGILPLIVFSQFLLIPLFAANYLSKRSASRGPLLILVGVQIALTLQSSMLGLTATAVRDIVLTFVVLKKRVPIGVVGLTIAAFLVFNPAKVLFRQQVAEQGPVTFEQSIELWEDALAQTWSQQTIERSDARNAAFKTTTSRLDQNWASAHVYTIIPDRMPHQLGRTYEDIPMLLVPRIINPAKPTSQGHTRSRWLVELGVQTPGSIDSVAIALPASAEAYWNFGWLGVVVVPLGLGGLVGLLFRVRIADPIGRSAWVVMISTCCTAFGDMLVWIVPQLVIALISAVLVTVYCGLGRSKSKFSMRGSSGAFGRSLDAAGD